MRADSVAAACLLVLVAAAGGAAAGKELDRDDDRRWRQCPFVPVGNVLAFADARLRLLRAAFPPVAPGVAGVFPGRTTSKVDGTWPATGLTDFVAGFYPGRLWHMHALTGRSEWADAATALLPSFESVQNYTGSHDVGFISLGSYGLALQVAYNARPRNETLIKAYEQVLLGSAASLATRFKPSVGTFRSQDRVVPADQHDVIIENVVNLELMWTAAKLKGGKAEWWNMALSHARRSAVDHFRPDGSTFQVVQYSLANVTVTLKRTQQGFADNSTWTRGQAYALHGYTLAYEATGERLFRTTAERAADYFLSRLSNDSVPVWDFDAPATMPWKDTSAGAIAAGGLLRLSRASGVSKGGRYRDAALCILSALGRNYLSSSAPFTPQPLSILRNGTTNGRDFGTGTAYGDFFFLGALRIARAQRLL